MVDMIDILHEKRVIVSLEVESFPYESSMMYGVAYKLIKIV